jgi:hypothetical protein
MSRSDLWRWSATRVEVDHRSRQARLRLEHLERLPIVRALPSRSWVRRVLNGGRTPRRSTKIDPPAAPPYSRRSHQLLAAWRAEGGHSDPPGFRQGRTSLRW